MTNNSRIIDYLSHLLVSCNRMAELRATVTRDQLLKDYRAHELALRFIETLGESAKRIDRIDPEFFDAHGLQDCRQVIGMRNRIAHQYEGVDLELVWQVLIDYAPALKRSILPVLLRFRPEADPDSLHF